MFIEWMKANKQHEEARELTYVEFPPKWVWHKDVLEWMKRKFGRSISRIFYAHPASDERYYLRMLLNTIRGSTSFENIRTVNKVLYSTFKVACYALGLLDDDKEWHDCLQETSLWRFGHQLR